MSHPRSTAELLAAHGPLRSAAANRMLVAAVAAFAELGFHGATTRAIAARCGLSPAAIYVYFATKEELLYSISTAGHDSALDCIATAGGDNSTERLANAVRDFAAWHARHHTLARVVQYELAALSTEHRSTIIDRRRKTAKALLDIIDVGIADQSFSCADPDGAVLALLSLCIDIGRWFPSPTHANPAALADTYAELALTLVGARR